MGPTELDARFRIVTTLWAALLGGVTVFTGVVWAMASGMFGPAPSPTLAPGMAAKLLVACPLLMGAGIAFRHGDVGTHAEAERWLAAYQTRVVVALALEESGALLGLVLCLLAGRPNWALGVWSLAAAAMALSRPVREDLERVRR